MSYIKHVLEEGKEIELTNRQLKLYTNKHPASFETLAMDQKRKEDILKDLAKFKKGKEYYSKIGKAWKRGYLLYGPPGKSITVIDLTGQRKKKKEEVENEEPKDRMRKNEEESSQSSKVTLSGLLNFIDGIWSACGGERIIIFIRRGRMDKHIEMSYCCFDAFKVLAKNYLDVESHLLFGRIGTLLQETEMSPADVVENLMPKSEDEDKNKEENANKKEEEEGEEILEEKAKQEYTQERREQKELEEEKAKKESTQNKEINKEKTRENEVKENRFC
ncbi:hypothetical protein V8G54_012972 [Vigna mungo]|uniref:AAA+ ATPase At3g28540-like C-terminal domain-containing protein n=1 Tax=Vigna mungo TaxID=3915 RepID=A0AAQ3S4D4_VIGMU